MNDELKQQINNWLRNAPSVHGTLVRGIRFPDETFVADVDSRDFSLTAMEQAWRSVADTFQVLAAQQMPAVRLTWMFERAALHCARREDGAILGVFVSRKQRDTDMAGLDGLMQEFQGLAGG